ncbi:MAG: protein kinase domain-containing protein [Planctomycetaceae bacterium]
MKPTTADNLAHLLATLDLVPAADLQQAQRECDAHALDAAAFGQALVRRELVTGFQLERLLNGETQGYFFGTAKLLYQIGSGSFARVYRGIHRDTGAMLAVKVLRKRFAADTAKRASFQHEGEMGRLLRHPNIVAIEDVGVEHGAAYLVMEFLEGGTLREVVKIRGAIETPRALDLVQQMLAGLEYAHRRGVTHRDLKATNVLVSSTGVAKLVDFGLARVDDGGDRALGRVEQPRTVDYAALEKLTGVRDDDVRGDVYFMGTLAYLVLAGRPALAESRDRAVRSDPQRFRRVEPLATVVPDLPRDVVDLVARMMHLDPLQRFQTAADARRAVEQVAARVQSGAAAAGSPAAAAGPAAGGSRPAGRGTIMLVESSGDAQRTLREFFAKLGFRVLVTENPQRALSRFGTQPPPADCLVISAQSLGAAAVEAFNAVSADPFLTDLPVILLAASRQADVAARAKTDGRRRLVTLPAQPDAITRLLDELVRAG